MASHELHPANFEGLSCSWYGVAATAGEIIVPTDELNGGLTHPKRVFHCSDGNKTVSSASPAKTVVASVAVPRSVYQRIAGARRDMVRHSEAFSQAFNHLVLF